MNEINEDPIGDIRQAMGKALKATVEGQYRLVPELSHKEIVDFAIDSLPDFFRQPLKSAEANSEVWTGANDVASLVIKIMEWRLASRDGMDIVASGVLDEIVELIESLRA